MTSHKKIYTLGPKGSFHHLACKEYLGGEKEIKFCENFAAIFEAVRDGNLGWIALFNTLAGVVDDHEVKINTHFNLLDEMDYEVNLCLCATNGTALKNISSVYSHEKAIAESKRFIREKLPHVELVRSSSTSNAAQYVADENRSNQAAICHAETARFYGLEILALIPNKSKNLTTFGLFTA